jgi:hypothetical protein
MTEQEWGRSADPKAMLGLVRANVSDRKLWLFACACLRRVESSGEPGVRAAVAMLERCAEGQETAAEMSASNGRVVALAAAVHVTDYALEFCDDQQQEAEPQAQADLLREIVGNPLRPVTFDPLWRTSDVLLLATSIYDSQDFGPMPILADALQEAGCTSEELLSHLRTGGPHVKGCWALDLVLGKQ